MRQSQFRHVLLMALLGLLPCGGSSGQAPVPQSPQAKPPASPDPKRGDEKSAEQVLLKDVTLDRLPLGNAARVGEAVANLKGEKSEAVVDRGVKVKILDRAAGMDVTGPGDFDFNYDLVNKRWEKLEKRIDRTGEVKWYKVELIEGKRKGDTGWVPAVAVGVPEIITYRFTMTAVSWIDILGLPNPSESTHHFAMPDGLFGFWPAAATLGLFMTRNPTPDRVMTDFPTFQKTQQYRGAMWAEVTVEVDKATDRVTRCSLSKDPVLDPGWTPPADTSSMSLGARAGVFLHDDGKFHAGELSTISSIVTEKQHPNTCISLRSGENVVAEGLLRFRAGAHTDKLGTDVAGCPYHVPWVWNSTAVTYTGKGKFRLYSQGSAFPSHKWYIDGVGVAHIPQEPVTMSRTDPSLTKGVSARLPQVSASLPLSGPVDKADYTLPSGKLQTSSFSPAQVKKK
jgi:hypothetical protein